MKKLAFALAALSSAGFPAHADQNGELNKFLEAGWWVVGPYPTELKANKRSAHFAPP